MQGLTLFNLNLTHLLDAFLETAVPMIAGLAEVVGLFIIITSLAKATFYYVSAFAFDGTSIVSLCKPVKYSSQGFTFFTTR